MKRLAHLLIFLPLVALSLGAASVSFSEEPGRIQVLVAGRPFTTLHFSADLDKPFFHPFRTASGAAVTRGWPLDPAPGDTTDHPHQRGLWWAHGLTNKVDFWTNVKGTGRYRLKSPPVLDRGKGSIRLNLEMVAADNRVLGSLIEEYTFSAAGDSRLVDIAIRILADRDSAIVLGDTKEGISGLPRGGGLDGTERRYSDQLRRRRRRETDLGQARTLGGLLRKSRRDNRRRRHVRPSREPELPHLLDGPRLWSAGVQCHRRAGIHRRPETRRQYHHPTRCEAGVPPSPSDPSRRRKVGEDRIALPILHRPQHPSRDREWAAVTRPPA